MTNGPLPAPAPNAGAVLSGNSDRALPTIRDVAAAAGVSIATASRALTGHRDVSERTRRLVERIAQEIGYQRNMAAAILGATGKSTSSARPVLGFVICHAAIANATKHRGVCRLFTTKAAEFGLSAECAALSTLDDLPVALRTLHARGCEGIVFSINSDEPYWERLPSWERFTVLAMGGLPHAPFHQLRRMHFDDTCRAWDVLRERGYRRIGAAIMRHGYPEPTDRQRLGAVLSCQATYPDMEVIPPLLEMFPERLADFRKWMRAHQPDAVISFGVGTRWNLENMGLSTPEDVGLVGLHGGDHRVAGHPRLQRPLTGYRVTERAYFEAAIPVIAGMLAQKSKGIPDHRRVFEIAGEWVEGETIRPAGFVPPSRSAQAASKRRAKSSPKPLAERK